MNVKPTTRQLLTASLAVALAGTAVVTTGVANAAPGATAKLSTPVIQQSSARAVTVLGTGFKNANGTSAIDPDAADHKVVGAASTCAATALQTLAVAPGVVSPTKLTATIPSITTVGNYKLCIKTTATTATFVTAPFSVAAAPAFHATAAEAVVPASGPTAAGASVVLTAADASPFRPNSVVTFGNVLASKVTVAKDGSSIVAVAPAGAAGAANVVVSAPGFDSVTQTGGYTYTNTVAVSPRVARAGDVVTINGAGFTSTTKVFALVGGALTAGLPCATQQVVSATEITCKLLPSALPNPAADFADEMADGRVLSFVTGTGTNTVASNDVAPTTVTPSSTGSSLSTLTLGAF